MFWVNNKKNDERNFFLTFLTFLILSESTVSFYVVSYLSVSNERLIFVANETSGKCSFYLFFLF